MEKTSKKIEIPQELRETVRNTMRAAGALGPLGAFSTMGDVAAIAGCWGTLLVVFADHYGMKMTKETAVKACSSVLLGIGSYYAGCKLASKLFNMIPFAGTVMGMGISSAANILFTYRFALTLTRMFGSACGDLDNIVASIVEMFKTYGAIGSAADAFRMLIGDDLAGRF